VPPDLLVLKGSRGLSDLQVLLVPKVIKGTKEKSVLRGLRVFKVLRVYRVYRVFREILALQDRREKLDLQGHKVIRVLMVQLAQQGFKVNRV
jgi:hypothetical protein